MDGKRFKLTDKQLGVNFPPLHPNCRCTTIAFDPDDDIEEFKERLEHGELNYDKWYEKYVDGRKRQSIESKQGEDFTAKSPNPQPIVPNGDKISAEKSLTNAGIGDIINRDDIFIHPNKINKFCLDPNGKHSNEFFDVGYKTGDFDALYQDILKNFDEGQIVDRVLSDDNVEKFSIFMELGVDKKKRFRTVWQKDTPDSKPRFITAHRED